jgi:hypothetical protein
LADVSEDVLKAISQLEALDPAKSVLDMGVYHELSQPQDLPDQMEGVSKSTLLPLLGGQGFDWFKVEIVIQMEVVQVLSVDQQVEHVVALSTHLETYLYPI